MRPYIGITDFMSQAEVRVMQRVFARHKPKDFLHQLHVGVMMSYKTLYDMPTQWSDAFPPKIKIWDIFCRKCVDDVLYCLHYADNLTRKDLWRSLRDAISWGGPHIHALQLDLVWPDRYQIYAAIVDLCSQDNLQIILQINKQAFDEVGNNPKQLVEKLTKYVYDDTVHRVLLDKSMGRGVGMDAQALLPFVEAIKTDLPQIGVGIAGGLGPQTYKLAEPILKLHNDISVDAQGKLRSSGNALDPIDWNMAGAYITQMINMIKKYHH